MDPARRSPERYRTPPAVLRHNLLLLLASVGLTVLALRAYLHLAPDTDLDVAGFNVHHLFTGLLLITAGGVPLALFRGSTRRLDLCLLVFGAGLGMALDEWVYLIATDGSNASYLLPVSFWGAVALVGGTCLYAVGLARARLRRDARGGARIAG